MSNIAGFVYIDEGRRSNYSNEDFGLAGITVILYDENKQRRITQTDANGAYLFHSLPAGKYVVNYLYNGSKYYMDHAYPAAGEEYIADDVIFVELDGGEFSRPNNFSLRPRLPTPLQPDPVPVNRLWDTGSATTGRLIKLGLK